jgi:hypothetical protein
LSASSCSSTGSTRTTPWPQAKEAITGTPTDKSMWLIIGGIIGIIVGGLGSMFRRSS